jgi:hypothetical protein
MNPYANLSGDSAVRGYELADTWIIVEFKSGLRYLYDYSKPGASDVEKMKERALAGKGLATFISKRVKERYARKLA